MSVANKERRNVLHEVLHWRQFSYKVLNWQQFKLEELEHIKLYKFQEIDNFGQYMQYRFKFLDGNTRCAIAPPQNSRSAQSPPPLELMSPRTMHGMPPPHGPS
jgi:hypothetical protein